MELQTAVLEKELSLAEFTSGTSEGIPLLVNEIQLLLAEKRTALAVMRTGIAVFALPLSVFSVLIATSRLYDASNVVHLLLPVLLINFGLIALAVYLITRSVRRQRFIDKLVCKLKERSPVVAELVA
ncbi:MAG: hypothetical protein ACYTFG_03160 [Planctomycetota bacterium]|jgi:uncharacterized membrane protein YidH (DUF202 family)